MTCCSLPCDCDGRRRWSEPRYEVVIDIEDGDCPCCGASLRLMGELHTEQLDIAPAQLRVRVTQRPMPANQSITCEVMTSPLVEHEPPRRLPTPVLALNGANFLLGIRRGRPPGHISTAGAWRHECYAGAPDGSARLASVARAKPPEALG